MDDQHTPISGTPIYQESQEKNAKWLWLLIIIIIIGALVFAFVRGIGPFANLKLPSGEEQASPSPRLSSPLPSPESSPEADLDKSEPEIRILNGSGTAGVASVVSDLLEGKGWTVASVGNADNFDYDQTVLRFKESFSQFASLLEADLEDDYSVIVDSEAVDASSSADIEVIVGSK